jgi:hypothetical protein
VTVSGSTEPIAADGPDGAVDGGVDPVVLAVIAAAVDQVWPRPRAIAVEEERRRPAWRFSGRWWSRPATTRRERPWAGG